MSAEIPLWAILLMALGQFGPIAVPALLICAAMLVGRFWKASEVTRAARQRARISDLKRRAAGIDLEVAE